MPASEERLRPPPSDRLTGPELFLNLSGTLEILRKEPSPQRDGHRQATVLHRGHVRLVLFAFNAGGRLATHRARGLVTIQALRGTIIVRTPEARYELVAPQALALDPGVEHEVDAPEEADMLLGVHMDKDD